MSSQEPGPKILHGGERQPPFVKIMNKIRNQIFEREFKRFVRELKTRAVVEIEQGI